MRAAHALRAGIWGGVMLLGVISCEKSPSGPSSGTGEQVARPFVARYLEKTRALEKASNLAWWQANLTGKEEDFQAKEKAENALDAVLSDPKAFAELKSIRDRGGIADEMLKREIDLIYLKCLEKQVEPALLQAMVAKSNAVDKQFNTYRAEVGGKRLSENDVRKILRESKD